MAITLEAEKRIQEKKEVRGGRGKQMCGVWGTLSLRDLWDLSELGEGHREHSVENISEFSLTFPNLPNTRPSSTAPIISNIRRFEFEIGVFSLFIYFGFY